MPNYEKIGQAFQQNPEGLTAPQIAAMTQSTPRKVGTALKALEAAGLVFDSGQSREVEGKRTRLWFASNGADFSNVERVRSTKTAKAARPRKRKKRTPKKNARQEQAKGIMLQCVRKVAEAKAYFTADDVRELFDETSGNFAGLNTRVAGPVLGNAVKEGWCVPLKGVAIRSGRRRGGLSRVYRSLLFDGPMENVELLDDPMTMRHEDCAKELLHLRAENAVLKCQLAEAQAALEARPSTL